MNSQDIIDRLYILGQDVVAHISDLENKNSILKHSHDEMVSFSEAVRYEYESSDAKKIKDIQKENEGLKKEIDALKKFKPSQSDFLLDAVKWCLKNKKTFSSVEEARSLYFKTTRGGSFDWYSQ